MYELFTASWQSAAAPCTEWKSISFSSFHFLASLQHFLKWKKTDSQFHLDSLTSVPSKKSRELCQNWVMKMTVLYFHFPHHVYRHLKFKLLCSYLVGLSHELKDGIHKRGETPKLSASRPLLLFSLPSWGTSCNMAKKHYSSYYALQSCNDARGKLMLLFIWKVHL